MSDTAGLVVVFLNQDEHAVCRIGDEIPEDALSFSSPAEMAKFLNIRTMDMVRMRLLNQHLPPSRTREDAAASLWATLIVNPDKYRLKMPDEVKRKRTVTGSLKFDASRRELFFLAYEPKKNAVTDGLVQNLIAPQAQMVLHVLQQSGSRIFTFSQMVELLEYRDDLIRSRSPMPKLLTYYLTKFFYPMNVIKKITYLDFATNPKYRGFSLNIGLDGLF